jgi:hypothetical protein
MLFSGCVEDDQEHLLTIFSGSNVGLRCPFFAGQSEMGNGIQKSAIFFFLLRLGLRAASNSAYSGYPELWIIRYPAHRYIRTHDPLVESPTS